MAASLVQQFEGRAAGNVTTQAATTPDPVAAATVTSSYSMGPQTQAAPQTVFPKIYGDDVPDHSGLLLKLMKADDKAEVQPAGHAVQIFFFGDQPDPEREAAAHLF